jgi:hypothetical protein
MSELKPLRNERQAAQILGRPVGTLRNWRVRGRGPDFVKLGTSVGYTDAALERFIADNTRVPHQQSA